MATSQNGWSANDRSIIATYTVPGTTLRIPLRKGDVSVVLLEYLRRYHLEVESLYHVPQDLWGYASRTIRGSSTTLSNHASGTAVDARAVKNGLGMRDTFTAEQEDALTRLLAWFEGVLRHGRDWSRPDPMHAEIDRGAAEVRRIADKIRAGGTAVPVPPKILREDASGPEVVAAQNLLIRAGFNPGPVDGRYGPATIAAVRAFQAARGLDVDGEVGPQTWAALRGSPTPPAPAPPPAAPPTPALWTHPVPDYYTEDPADRMWASECLAWGTAHAANARDAARGALAKMGEVEAKVDTLLARQPAGQAAALSDADVARIAEAVLDGLAARAAD